MGDVISKIKNVPKKSSIHRGYDISPIQAYNMLNDNYSKTYLVDVRTIPEFIYVGHPLSAINIPYKFWTGNFVKGLLELVLNKSFSKELHKRFDSENDKLIFICRSGIKSCNAVNCAVNTGWNPKNTFNLLGGFEGDLVFLIIEFNVTFR